MSRISESKLTPNGLIVVADISFPTSETRQLAHSRWIDLWDDEEFYWIADEASESLEIAGLDATYVQVSSCGGVYRISGKPRT